MYLLLGSAEVLFTMQHSLYLIGGVFCESGQRSERGAATEAKFEINLL